MMNFPTVQALICKKPLLLYLSTNLYAIGVLIAKEDGGGIEQPIYDISHALKDVETCYPRVEDMSGHSICLAKTTPLFLSLQGVIDD